MERAGIDPRGVCLHSMRYTFASRLFEQGYSLPEVQKLTGHKTTRVLLEIYAQATGERENEMVESLFVSSRPVINTGTMGTLGASCVSDDIDETLDAATPYGEDEESGNEREAVSRILFPEG